MCDILYHRFVFLVYNTNEQILFGEAKYVANSNAYNNAIKQINRFITEKRDQTDLPDLVQFNIANAISNASNGDRGFIAGFSSTTISDANLEQNIKDKLNEYSDNTVINIDNALTGDITTSSTNSEPEIVLFKGMELDTKVGIKTIKGFYHEEISADDMEKYVVTFRKSVCKEVEADSREAATEAALDLINKNYGINYEIISSIRST